MNFEIDKIATEYEKNWSINTRALGEYLERVELVDRSRLLQLLIEVDVQLAAEAGVDVVSSEYETFGNEAVNHAERFLFEIQDQTRSQFRGDSEESPDLVNLSGDVDRPSEKIGPYKILQLIGRGGMGQVYMAERTEPYKSRVALKIINTETPTKQILGRFEAERQALAMMNHQNIAKVLDAGTTDDGRPYFAMELVKGIPITKYCDQNKLSPNERLELFVQTCRAIQHAHTKGIVHRDIKPSNVLVTLYDGKPVAKVIDFGLAKALQDGSKLTDRTLFTQFGQVVGTLAYMSPEQAEMNALDVDTRTDVYSLGVILYELLTGSTPITREQIKTEAFDRVLALIREEEAVPPSKRLSESGDEVTGLSLQRRTEPKRLNLILKGDLDWIAIKALEKDRTRRYETPSALADDVQRFLENEAIEARPPSFGYRLQKAYRKNKGSFVTAALVFGLLIASVIAIGGMYLRASQLAFQNGALARENKNNFENAQRALTRATKAEIEKSEEARRAKEAEANAKNERDNARRAEKRQMDLKEDALAQKLELESSDARLKLLLANARWLQGRAKEAQRLLWEIPSNYRGSFEWRLSSSLSKGSNVTLYGHADAVNCAVFSPDGQTIASGGKDASVCIWDVVTGRQLAKLPTSAAISDLCYSPDGRRLAAVIESGRLLIWDSKTFAEASSPQGNGPISYSPDSKLLASTRGSQIVISDPISGKIIREINKVGAPDFEAKFADLLFTPDSKQLVVSLQGGGLRLIDVKSGNRTELGNGFKAVENLRFNIDGFLAMSDGTTYDWSTNKKLYSAKNRGTISPDGMRRAVIYDSEIKIFQLKQNRTTVLKGHVGKINSIAFSPNGAKLVSCSDDNSVKIWDIKSQGQGMTLVLGNPKKHHDYDFGAIGNRIAINSGNELKVFDVARRNFIFSKEFEVRQEDFCISPDEKRIASFGSDGLVTVWDLDNQQLKLSRRFGHPSAISGSLSRLSYSLKFSPDCSLIATSHVKIRHNEGSKKFVLSGFELNVTDVENGKQLLGFSSEATLVDNIIWSHDGTKIAANWGRNLSVWQIDTGETIWSSYWSSFNSPAVSRPTEIGVPAALSPDGTKLLLGSKPFVEFDFETGVELNRSNSSLGNFELPKGIVYGPDGAVFVTAHYDSIRLWDAASMEEIITFENEDSSYVSSVAIGSQGQLLAGYTNGNVKIWSLLGGEKRSQGHPQKINAVCFSPKGELIASGSDDMTVKLWSFPGLECLKTFDLHTSEVNSVRFSPDGNKLASSSFRETIVWNVATGQKIFQRPSNTDNSFSDDGEKLVIGGFDGGEFFELKTGEHVFVNKLFELDKSKSQTFFAKPDEKPSRLGLIYNEDSDTYLPIVTGKNRRKVFLNIIRKQQDAKETLVFDQHESAVILVAVDPDSQRMITGCIDGQIRIWDLETKEVLTKLKSKGSEAISATLSNDLAKLATVSKDGIVLVSDASTGEELHRIKTPSRVTFVGFSPDDDKVYYENNKKIYVAALGDDAFKLHSAWPGYQRFDRDTSPDGRWTVVPSGESIVLVDNKQVVKSDEARYWAAIGSPDPRWHLSQAIDNVDSQNWYAATFHAAHALYYDHQSLDAFELLEQSWPKVKSKFKASLPSIVYEALKISKPSPLSKQLVPSPAKTNKAIWEKVRESESDVGETEIAKLEFIVEMEPRGIYYNTLGVAYYRFGKFEAAIEALQKSVELAPKQEEWLQSPHPADYAFLAMCYLQLGDRGQAESFRGKFKSAMKVPPFNEDEECNGFAKELDVLFQAETSK